MSYDCNWAFLCLSADRIIFATLATNYGIYYIWLLNSQYIIVMIILIAEIMDKAIKTFFTYLSWKEGSLLISRDGRTPFPLLKTKNDTIQTTHKFYTLQGGYN